MFRDRIKELRRVKASELAPSPNNWRKHPAYQKKALEEMLSEVGFADAVLARETAEGLEIIDGHLRTSLDAEQEVPVLILDVNAEEAKRLLLTLDPLAALAQGDEELLVKLMEEVPFESDTINSMLEDMLSAPPPQIAEDEWMGMPEYLQEDLTAYKQIVVNFASPGDMEAFSELVGQPVTPKTRSIWHPKAEVAHTFAHGRYISEEEAQDDKHNT